MDLISFEVPSGSRRDRFFARATGTVFDVRASSDTTEIDLFDQIGMWGVDARSFNDRLKAVGPNGNITLRINSPGGDVFDGLAIYNSLISHQGNVRVEIVGVAASIASIIAMAGDEIIMADNAFVMIHNAWTLGIGNKAELTKLASTLGKIDEAMARTYAARTGTGIRTIKQMMDDETWMTSKEAKEAGFATEILDASGNAKARFDLSVFGGVPDSLKWPDENGDEPSTERDWERLAMQDAGWSRSRVRAFKRALKPAEAPEAIEAAKQDAGDEVDLTKLADAIAATKAKLNLQ